MGTLEPIALLIGLGLGLLLGGLVAWLFLEQKRRKDQQQIARLEGEHTALQGQLTASEKQLQEYRVRQIEHQEQVLDLTRDLSRMQESYAQLNQALSQREADLERLQERFKAEFENLAGRVMEENARKLGDDQQRQLNHLLQPLQEKLLAFEKRVQDTYQSEARERFSLQREIERLAQLHNQMSEDAQNLTKALKGDSKTQGNWGELVLTRVLESSGLREGEEFVVQGKDLDLRSVDGQRLQPDVIIKLPEEKHLIVDSKVSLTAYDRFVSSTTDEERHAALKQHLVSVTTHIKQLSDKHYSQLKGLQSPDFVLLFMAVEPAFSLALQSDPELFQFAWQRRIVLVSPTTLLATLKTVASLWRLEQQNRNAEEIARQGGALYDKFVGFVEELKKVGTSLDRAQKQYNESLNKLHHGHGSLSSRAEKLRELGIDHRKKLL